MTPEQQHLLKLVLAAAGGIVALVLAVRLIGPAWLRGLFESEKEPSIRLVLAATIGFGTLAMQATGRINAEQASINYTCVSSLLLIGSARIAAKAFAQRPAAIIKADTAPVTAETATILPPANDQPTT